MHPVCNRGLLSFVIIWFDLIKHGETIHHFKANFMLFPMEESDLRFMPWIFFITKIQKNIFGNKVIFSLKFNKKYIKFYLNLFFLNLSNAKFYDLFDKSIRP